MSMAANGAYGPDTQPVPADGGYSPDMASNVVTINFGLKWRHIAAVVFGAPAFVASLATAGWLVMPAKQSDLEAVKQQVSVVERSVKTVEDVGLRLTAAMEKLGEQVQSLVDRPIPSDVPAPTKRKRRAAAGEE